MTTFLDSSLGEILGIEFKEDRIVFTHLKNSLSGMRALSSEIFPFKSDDDNVSAIREYLSQHGISDGRVFVSIPDRWTITRYTDLPLTRDRGKGALSQLMRYEIERHIPFQIEDISYDFQITDEHDTAFTVLFVAVPNEKIDSVKGFLHKLSLHPDVITISSLSILNAIELSSVPIGGWQEVAGLARKSGIFHKPDEVNISLYTHGLEASMAIIKDGSCVDLKSFLFDEQEPLKSFIDDMVSYLKNIQSEISSEGFNNLFLSGETSSMPGIEDALKESLEINIIPVNLLDTLKGPELTGIAASAGAAFAGLGIGPFRINILQHKADHEMRRTAGIFAKIFMLMTLLLTIAIATAWAVKEKRYLQLIENQVEKNEPSVRALEKLTSEINLLERQRDFLMNVQDKEITLEVLRELSKILPLDTWVTNLDYKGFKHASEKKSGGEIVISGFSVSSSKLISILEDSPLFEQVGFVGAIRKRRGKEGFKLKAYLVTPEDRLTSYDSSETDVKPVTVGREEKSGTAD